MSVNTVLPVTGGVDPWTTVVTDYGSDAYLQHVGDASQSLLISNNASFRGVHEIAGGLLQDQVLEIARFNQNFDILRVYEGEAIQAAGPLRSAAHPDFDSSDDLTFVLPSMYVDPNSSIRVSGTLAVNGREWSIEQTGNSASDPLGIRLQSGADVINVTAQFVSQSSGVAFLRLPNVATAVEAGVEDDVSLRFVYDPDVSIGGLLDPDLDISLGANDVLPAADQRIDIEVFGLREGQQLIPSATRGSVRLSMGNVLDLNFVVSPTPTIAGGDTFDVLFYQSSMANRVARFNPGTYQPNAGLPDHMTNRIWTNNGFDDYYSNRWVEGRLNSSTGIMTLTSNGLFGFEVSQVESALYDYSRAEATEVTLYAGFDHATGLEVALPSPNSKVQIDSRIDTLGGVVLAASTVEVNAPIRSVGGFSIELDVNSPLGVATEEVVINSPLTTSVADIYVTDRADTSTPSRSQVRIGATGSITADNDYFLTGGFNTAGNPTLAARVYVSAETGDIIIDGEVAATQHTYVMQSASDDNSRFKAPFVLSTGSFASGLGRIIGNDVVVSLGNDIYGNQLSTSAVSQVSIDTDVDRLRVRAGSRRGDVSSTPFPYELRVREADALIVDAMASSSRSLDIFAQGDLTVSAAIRSGGDVSLRSGQTLWGKAPVETSFGTIEIQAPTVSLAGAVRVLDTIPDERRTDISIRATGPNFLNPVTGVLSQALELRDSISAVNNVELTSDLGSVSGRGVVVADTLLATAAENIILHTDVHSAKVEIQTPAITAPGLTGIIALYEEDYIAVDARNARAVVLSAQGDDAYLQDPRDPEGPYQLSSALIARVGDAQTIFASAPSGSVDLSVSGSTELQIGNLQQADITTITQANPLFHFDGMLAAGSVSIVGVDAEKVQLYDGPNALSSAINARFATHEVIRSVNVDNQPVDVHWSPGQPGFDRAELEFTLPVIDVMRLVGYIGENETPELTGSFLDSWNQEFRESDIILVKNGAVLDEPSISSQPGEPENKVNGVYQIAERSYGNVRGTNDPLMTVRLVRLQSRDQTAEVSRTHYVKVAKFGEADASEWVSWQGVSVVAPDSVSGEDFTNIVVREIESRPGFTAVKAVTTQPIKGSYESGLISQEHYGRITSRIEQAISEASELFGGVVLGEGDLVLVQFGTDQDANPGALASARTNGIYKVIEKGRNQNAFGLNGDQWVLERYQGVDENGDGFIDEVFTGIAAVNQGLLRTSVTGKMFEYSYDAINLGDIEYTKISNGLLLDEENTPRYEYYQTSVGSNVEGAQIELTVSAASGGNNDGGTLGRMLNLLQQNKTDRPMLLSFDANLIRQDGGGSQAVVTLSEQLPAITRAVAINGNNVIVDGSGIVANSAGQELRGLSGGRYFGPVRPSEVAFARRQVLSRAPDANSNAGNGKNGLEFGLNADGSIVRNLRIGGFDEGSAVFIQGADNILLEDMVIGGGATEFTAIGKRLTNEYGVTVAGYGNKTGYGVTLRDVSVNDAAAVGINLRTGTQGVRILESTVGSEGYRNEVGIRIGDVLAENKDTPVGEYLHQVIGVAGDPNARSLSDQAVTLFQKPEVVEGVEQWLVEVDASLVTAGLRPGLVAYDRVSGRIWTVADISLADAEATNRVVTLELQDGDDWGGGEDFENWTAALEFGTLMKLTEGSDVVTIPYGGFDFRNVFLGQEISISDPNAFTTDPLVRLLLHDQAVLTASLKNDQSGEIERVTVTHAGSGYPPGETLNVTFSAPEGDGGEVASGTAIVDENGMIESITVVSRGLAYQAVPTVTLPSPSRQKQAQAVLELSEPAALSGWVFATFEVPDGRNDVAFNQTGIDLEGAAVRLVQTDVRESLGVGILVEDVQAWDDTKVSSIVAGQPVIEIGGQGVTAERTWGEPADRNVAVFANRGAGIVLTQDVFEAVGKEILEGFDQAGELSKEDRANLRSKFSNYVLIAGNYLGRDINGSEELANGTGIVRNIGTGSLNGKAAAFASAIFGGLEEDGVRVDHDEDAGENEKSLPLLPEDFVSLERYRALFRPEDFVANTDVFTFDPEIGELDPRILLDRAKIRDLEAIHDRDSLSNLHGTVPKYQAGDDNPDDPVGGGGGGTGSDGGDDGNNWWDDFPILR